MRGPKHQPSPLHDGIERNGRAALLVEDHRHGLPPNDIVEGVVIVEDSPRIRADVFTPNESEHHVVVAHVVAHVVRLVGRDEGLTDAMTPHGPPRIGSQRRRRVGPT